MKKLILGAILLFSIMLSAQTTVNLSGMTANITLGQNCSSSQTPQEYVTTGDVNLNGRVLNLRNVKLTVNGNINGGGSITHCGQSNIVISGVVQNNPNLNGIPITTTTLNVQEYDFTQSIDGLKYIVYDLQGRVLSQGVTDKNTFSKLESNRILFIKIEGYRILKIYKN